MSYSLSELRDIVAPAWFAGSMYKGLGCAVGLLLAGGIAPTFAETVQINDIDISGNQRYSDAMLTAQVKDRLGKPLTFAEVQALARRIERHYHAAGYTLAKVMVPRQDFTADDTLELVVLEGRLGTIEIRGNERYADRDILSTLASAGLERDQVFSLQDLERGLSLLNTRSGIEASSTLAPGASQGTTDVIIDIEESPRVTGGVEVNNYGSEDTGEYRFLPSLSFLNLTGRGDQLDIMGMKSLGEGDAYLGYAGYRMPINMSGTTSHFYGFKGNVAIGQEFRVLEVEGDSDGWGVGVSQEYLLSSRSRLILEAWFEGQDLEQSMLDTTITQDRVRKLRLGAAYDHSDAYGQTLLSTDLHQGLGDAFGGMAEDDTLSSRSYARADNSFTKLTFDVARLQRISSRLTLIPRLYGQYAFNSVVAGEQWAIGGFNSVMGHPVSVYAGDSGVTASLESRYALLEGDDRYQFTLRADHGRVYVRNPYLGRDRHQDISGIGVGLIARPLEAVDFRATWGVPVGEETGDDTYVYAQASYRF